MERSEEERLPTLDQKTLSILKEIQMEMDYEDAVVDEEVNWQDIQTFQYAEGLRRMQVLPRRKCWFLPLPKLTRDTAIISSYVTKTAKMICISRLLWQLHAINLYDWLKQFGSLCCG